jgi:NAD+ diphosphatase
MLVEMRRASCCSAASALPAGSYSALAGFVEPGETIEEAVRARGVRGSRRARARVRYVASQPWPFPSQLMIGCLGHADSLELAIDTDRTRGRALVHARRGRRGDWRKGATSASFMPPTAAGDRAYPAAMVAGELTCPKSRSTSGPT